MREDDPRSAWIKIKPDNLKPVGEPSYTGCSEEPIYDLFALCKHIGSAIGGHYEAYARGSVNDIWNHYDDDLVQPVSAAMVQAQTDSAYMLFYVRRGHHGPDKSNP